MYRKGWQIKMTNITDLFVCVNVCLPKFYNLILTLQLFTLHNICVCWFVCCLFVCKVAAVNWLNKIALN